MDQASAAHSPRPVDSTDDLSAETVGGAEGDRAKPAQSQALAMRTVLRRFSNDFDQRVRPLTEPLARAIDTLTDVSNQPEVESLLVSLRELAHQVQALVDKVAAQHAYVLIFGPLKSGKSTFMNALCRSYVSEVTSLPAYPCVVHVCHSDQAGYTVTRYDGSTEPFDDAAKLHEAVEAAHRALVERIRQVEGTGTDFDPDTHMPEAICRIDVTVAAEDLAQSGAVLVDTPGLYTRMKFGYDRMTRNFRNAAAFAIFIVKADNLFLEQVFDEFHELLDLFSRIFLIVNIDSTKMDLNPDGQLVPSLERDDPGRIVKAFEDLAMSVGLKAAADAGRLSIYPVDLLSAASQRLRTQSDQDRGDVSTGQADFNTLLWDLTQYLNSSEYLRAFMADSVRRAQTLLEQLDDVTGELYVTDLADRIESLRQRREAATVHERAISRLDGVDWLQHLQSFRASLFAGSRDEVEQVARTARYTLSGAVDAWFETDQSLAGLNDDEVSPLLAKAQTELLGQLSCRMQQRIAQTPGGLSVSPGVVKDLMTCQIDLDAMAQQAMDRVNPHQSVERPSSHLVGRDIPVRRRWWQWLLLRSKRAVADRLFGPTDQSTRPIPAAVKAKRLDTAGLDAIKKLTSSQLDELIDRMTDHVPEQLFGDYTTELSKQLGQILQDKTQRIAHELADLERELVQAQRVLDDLRSLGERGHQTQKAVDDLAKHFGDHATVGQDESTSDAAQTGQGY